MQFKKPVLAAMPVLDVSSLTPSQRQILLFAYDCLALQALSPFPNMANDLVRQAIDSAVAEAFDLPDFSILRSLLGQEPAVCLQPLS